MDGNPPAGPHEWFRASLKSGHNDIADVMPLSSNVWQVSRLTEKPFVLGVIAQVFVSAEHVDALISQGFGLDYIVNIPREGAWDGEAIRRAKTEGAGWGSVGDLYRAAGTPEPNSYVPGTRAFVERALKPHTNVRELVEISDKVYLIRRKRHDDLTVALIHQYTASREDVRNLRARYGKFDEILNTDPNGRSTSSAVEAAAETGAEIFNMRDLMARLNRQ